MNIKKLTTLAAVGIVSLLSTFQTPTKTEAALTAPPSYDYKYVYGGAYYGQFGFYSTASFEPVDYVRTTDGAYYNYSATIDDTNTTLPSGLQITMTFNRSNTTWTNPAGTIYRPSDTKIGSNNNVGDIKKFELIFDNNTSHDYYLYIDVSTSSTNVWYYYYYIENLSIGGAYQTILFSSNILNTLYVPSYRTTKIEVFTSYGQYLDAWYLKDLGVSDAYNFGYDQGEADGYQDGLNNNPNILLNGFQAMVGILVNFFLMIVNLEVFGVSITGIFAIIVIFVGIVWVLKLIRG